MAGPPSTKNVDTDIQHVEIREIL
ncbi:unnamed protein product [Plutella xylostella]|uniref:(diamondback moth) hypothetical protein n=1 Tax=Plutella xylostella TaxID=51655 RepID=A0A8S4G701_PLUXY|nr:unnamed protein product [Plutella xylostella]